MPTPNAPGVTPATRSRSATPTRFLARIAEYVDAGVSKFILRPLGGDDDTLLAQTRQLIEQVLPRAEARWPKRPKASDK
jgi:hypothetical protein